MHSNEQLPESSQVSACSSKVVGVSTEEILPLMVDTMVKMGNTLKTVGNQDIEHQERSSRRRSSSLSMTRGETYPDILNKKGRFVEKLTDALSLETHEMPKCRAYYNYMLKESFEDRYEEINDDIHIRMQEMKKLGHDNSRLEKQLDVSSTLGESETKTHEEYRKNMETFKDIKADLDILMKKLFKQEEIETSVLAVTLLMNAAIENMDCEEEQYVQLPSDALCSRPILFLLDACVIEQHPTDDKLYRFCIES